MWFTKKKKKTDETIKNNLSRVSRQLKRYTSTVSVEKINQKMDLKMSERLREGKVWYKS